MVLPIQSETHSVGVFLGQSRLRIPELQRPYSWGQGQAAELCDDLKRLDAPDDSGIASQHFFGTIVLLNANDQRTHIIDGQQRLTTTSLVLGLLEQSIIRVGERATSSGGPAAEGVAASAHDLAQLIRGLLWYPGPLNDQGVVEYFPRIEVSPEIRERYLALIQGEKPRATGLPKSPERNLVEVASLVQSSYIEKPDFKGLEPVNQLRHLESCCKAITEHLLVVCLTTQSPNAGYDLFECLNARGLDLEALDLVKVWMLSQMAGDREKNVAEAMRELSSGDREAQAAFFEDYYKIKCRKNPQKNKKNKSKSFALEARAGIFLDDEIEHATSIQDRLEGELLRMKSLSPVWHELKGDKIPSRINGGGQLRVWGESRLDVLSTELNQKGAILPLLTVAAEHGSDQLTDFVHLVHAVERFFFRFKVICRGQVGTLESAYYDIMKRIENVQSIPLDYAYQRLQDVIDAKANDALFAVGLQDKLTYSSANLKRIKYFLFALDTYSYPNPPKIDLIPDLTRYHIEHIAPQSPVGESELESALIDDIGNLTLLNPELNGGFGNKNFADKKSKALQKRSQNQSIDIAESRRVFYDTSASAWSFDEFEARRARLLTQAMSVFKLV